MAIIVENGNGLEDAVSYASVAMFKAYAQSRGVAIPADDKIEAALVAATDWIEATFGPSWKGNRHFGEQALGWPRDTVIVDGYAAPLGYLPPAIVKATCAMAVHALEGALYNNQDPTAAFKIEDTIGPITKKYSPLKPADMVVQRNFDDIRGIVAGLVKSFGFLTVVR